MGAENITTEENTQNVKTGIEQVKEVMEKTDENTNADTTTKEVNESAKTYDEAYIEQLKAEHSQEMAKAIEEAVKKATMSEDEKAEYAKQQKEAELERREKELDLKELKAETKGLLAENKLPDSLADIVMGNDSESTSKNIAAFKAAFDVAVQEQVESRLKGTTPSAGAGVGKADSKAMMSAEVDKYFD